MKKNLLIFLWALAPVALLAFHFGPGQAGLCARGSQDKH